MSIYEFISNCNFDRNSVVLEIGGHMGFDTEELYKRINGAKLYTFEPDPRNIQILRSRNIDKLSNIIEAAVSDKDAADEYFFLSTGKVPPTGNQFLDDTDWTASSSLRKFKEHKRVFPWCKLKEVVEVKTVCLDTFAKDSGVDHISFIWMDVQGAEDLVFLGAQDILKRTEYIYTEYSDVELYKGQKTLDEIIKLLPGEWMVREKYDGNILLENKGYRDSLIAESGFWKIKNLNEHVFDEDLAVVVMNYMHEVGVMTCVDFGCGPGKYTEYLNSNGIKTEGYDGNPHTPALTEGRCEVLDLTTEFDKGVHDCVLTLEVGEHIPVKYERAFVDNVIKHTNNLVILSWGIPDQGGYGHVNCKDNDYIKGLFFERGFENKLYIENMIRTAAVNTWFKNTVMVFKKKKEK